MKYVSFLLAMAFFLCSCAGTAEEEVTMPEEVTTEVVREEEKAALVVTDFRGEEIEFEKGFTLALDYVYGRKTSGFFYDNVSNPELFDAEGNFTGDKMLNDSEFVWGTYPTGRNFQEFLIWESLAKSYVNKDKEAYRPHYQKTMMEGPKLKCILRYVSTTNNTGNYYAHNEWEGDVVFYPYPESMGYFPMIGLTDWPEALVIQGERSNYSAVADCPEIKLGNVKKSNLNLQNMELADVEALFSGSDLVEVEIDFYHLEMAWVEEAHVEYAAGIGNIVKNKDL